MDVVDQRVEPAGRHGCLIMADDDKTRLDDAETRQAPSAGSAPARGPAVTSSTGWLSGSQSIDHGRFAPGTLLGGRYRIVGRLGRGGMGEVFRADDLKLGQPVALKFLPPDVDRDPARLMQLHTEVRMARQVSHPNVCRVYDIDEVDNHTFLSMEYVDGEDLGSLLRRIGRFSSERATELSRQVCAGLAAAHERGVIHRDLKPANVMLDATGKVRITDFGLAGSAGESLRAGTPAYMAPEQLAGGEVTAQSDIYALGLVLYELYTGQRAIEAKTIAELVRKQDDEIVPPSAIVPELDPAIDRAVLRCLERDPADRPAAALGVAAALPGGDPLSAALAAGETPSPEMVAAAGATEALRPLAAVAALVTVIVALPALAALSDRLGVIGRTPVRMPPIVLADRASQILHSLGYTEAPADSAYGFFQSGEYVRHLQRNPREISAERLAAGRPPALLFWYRTSPRELIPAGTTPRVSYGDPPHTVSGMAMMVLDPEGRLVDLNVIAPQIEEPGAAGAPEPDWRPLFAAAGLDPSAFARVPSTWTPRSHADSRAAWEGPLPGWPEHPLRVEAAAYQGRPMFLQLVAPWTQPTRMVTVAPSTAQGWLQTVGTAIALSVLFGSLLVAWHNLKRGRGDRRGAHRLAAAVLCLTLAAWVVGATHVSNIGAEIGRFFDGTGDSLWAAATLWVMYIALEPYVRRFWPSTLVSWSRLMAGRFRDPQVGRDILVGCVLGAVVTLLERVHTLLFPVLGHGPSPLLMPRLADLEGVRQLLAAVGSIAFNAPFNALWVTFFMVLLLLIFRRVWLTWIVGLLVFVLAAGGPFFAAGPAWLALVIVLVTSALILLTILRFGLLATTVFFLFNFLISNAALTLDATRFFFPLSTAMLVAMAALAAYGFYASRGGEPLLGRRILQ
jgi:hypothetical protein